MLPQYIKDAIIVSARCYAKAREKQKMAEDWIESNFGEDAISDDSIRDALIDAVEMTNNPLEAIKTIESILKSRYSS